jgi:proteasome beta subunit
VTPGPPDLPLSGNRRFGVSPSFIEALAEHGPEALRASAPMAPPPPGGATLSVPHGTTIIGLKFSGGVVMAGDRRATEGYSIADERIEKVFQADDYSAVSIAGVAGQAIEIVRLFQTELEHYEKVEGARLSLEGKANRLAQMIRSNFPMALQGLVVVPLFGGYDERRAEGRLFRYDATGGRWEEEDYMATGSGGRPAKGTLKKGWRAGMSRDDAVRLTVESLRDAAEEDVATGGPDPVRGIWPSAKVVTSDGVAEVPDDELRSAYEALVGERG